MATNISIPIPQKNGFTVYGKSHCAYCFLLEILMEETKEKYEKINCDEYISTTEIKQDFIHFIKLVGNLEESPKTFPIVFHNGEFIGGYTETNEFIRCNSMKFDEDF